MTLSDRMLKRVAWIVAGAYLVGVVLTLTLGWLARHAEQASGWNGNGSFLANTMFGLSLTPFMVVGLLIAARKPRNAIGWILLAIGVTWGLSGILSAYAQYGYAVHWLPLANWAGAFDQWTWVPAVGLVGTYLILLFPDGHLPSPRWRWLAWATGWSFVLASVSILFFDAPITTGLEHPATVPNPFGIHALNPILDPLHLTIVAVPVCIVACAISLVMRLRRSSGIERQQLKWLAFAGALIAVIYLIVMAFTLPYSFAGTDTDIPAWLEAAQNATIFLFGLIPVAIGFAVLRRRLYDIDVVISKTVVFGTLAAFITVVYVGIVVGVGALIGDTGNPVLSIGATAVVALLFGPVRERVRRFADRLVYGIRATPYEVMSGFARRVAGTLSVEEILPGMAEAAARGVGARVGRVRVALPAGERSVVWPDGAEIPDAFDRTLEVRYQGEPVGAIDVAKPTNEPFAPTEEQLLDDLAGQAGLALHNVRLTRELEIRAAELDVQTERLRASRERLVTARDQQRKGLERDIQQGPARQLLEIRRRLNDVGSLAADDPGAAVQVLDRLGEEANATLDELRDLARGIFPPLLVDKGVVAALDAHVRKVGANARVISEVNFAELRFAADVEACVYFCCVQAIQNVMRHAGNAASTIELALDAEILTFSVRDDGPGFSSETRSDGMGMRIMQDRIDALEGSLTIGSTPGRGTVVTGRLSARPLEMAG
jgi:signal transduction histidine kinase